MNLPCEYTFKSVVDEHRKANGKQAGYKEPDICITNYNGQIDPLYQNPIHNELYGYPTWTDEMRFSKSFDKAKYFCISFIGEGPELINKEHNDNSYFNASSFCPNLRETELKRSDRKNSAIGNCTNNTYGHELAESNSWKQRLDTVRDCASKFIK